MKTLFLLGNGFDINLGMKTRYCDFYDYYKKTESKSTVVSELKEEISGGITNWSDLELAFGKYTVKIKDLDEFYVVYEDIVDNLAEYLSKEESNIDLKSASLDKLLEDICLPEKYLTNEDIQEISTFRSKWEHTYPWDINIITLNYTRSIERILGDDIENKTIGKNAYARSIIFRNIYHIHGYTDKRLVLGLNDLTQIENTDFHEIEEVVESLVKKICNKVQRHNIDRICEYRIREADIICIFGSSIGETDSYLWELIGDQLRRKCIIIIFTKGEEIRERFAQKAARTKRKIKNHFLDKTDLSDEEKKKIKENIYVGINTSLFSIM